MKRVWKKTAPFFLLLVLGGALACQRGSVFQVETVHFEKGLGDCVVGSESCTYLQLAYPRLAGGWKAGRDALNAEILRFALQGEEDDSGAEDAEAAAEALMAEYQKFKREYPASPQVWWQKRSVEVLANDPKVFSLVLENTEYMGGAHPNQSKDFRSYDPKSGRRYRLSDWLKPGYQQVLNTLGEEAFRKARQLAPNIDLNDAGFTFEHGFELNDNFAATPAGLVFYFNAYEIASYADGPTELTIPYSALKDWLLPGGPLSSLAKR